jgi:hypothetical protein
MALLYIKFGRLNKSEDIISRNSEDIWTGWYSGGKIHNIDRILKKSKKSEEELSSGVFQYSINAG